MLYQPPFTLSNTMTTLVANIAELIGLWKATNHNTLVPELRRGNRIKTIQASLAVEQNTLSIEQVTAVFEGKTVLGQPREIQEVRNAFKTYEAMDAWQAFQLNDLLQAHSLLMQGLVDDAGQLRSGGAGIYQGEKLVHMAPPASQVHRLMGELLHWLETTDAHPLIASAAFHYDFEFIHPFSDGNGRMGRLWQTLILSSWQPLLAYLPVETVIKHRQQEYYDLLKEADTKSDCSRFIEFLLQAIEGSLNEAIVSQANTSQSEQTKTTQITTQITTLKTTLNQRAILDCLTDNPKATRKDLAAAIEGITEDGVKYNLKVLQKAGFIERIGSARAGHWNVKK